MKTTRESAVLERHYGRRGPLHVRSLLALVSLALILLASDATAQGVNVPESKNTQLRKIARLYDALEYEAALELLSKAEKHPANKAQERLWLELMKGVLHYSLQDEPKATTAFLKALEQSPYTSLPVVEPSPTLYVLFDTLRGKMLRARAAKNEVATNPPLPTQAPSVSEKTASEQSAAKSQPFPAKRPEDKSQAVTEEALSREVLLGRLDSLEKQERQSGGGKLPPKLETLFEHVRALIQEAETPEARRAAALRIDSLKRWSKSEVAEEERVADSDDPSQELLLTRLSTLEAKGRKLTGMDLSPTVAVLFKQARGLIQLAKTSEQRRFMALWIQDLDVFLTAGRSAKMAPGPSTHKRSIPEARALSGISPSILIQRVFRLTGWLHDKGQGRNTHQDLTHELEQLTHALVASPTGHERMLLAIRMDRLQERIHHRFDGQKQSTNTP